MTVIAGSDIGVDPTVARTETPEGRGPEEELLDMNGPNSIRQAAVNAAIDKGDLTAAISSMVRITRDRRIVEAAIAQLNHELERDAHDPVLRRARNILTGALSTTPATTPRHEHTD